MLPNYSHRIFSILVLSGYNHLWFIDASHVGDGEIIEAKKHWFLCVFAFKQNLDLNSPHSSFQQHLVAGSPSVWPPPIRSSCPEKQKLSDKHFLCGMFSQRDFKPFLCLFLQHISIFSNLCCLSQQGWTQFAYKGKINQLQRMNLKGREWAWQEQFFCPRIKKFAFKKFHQGNLKYFHTNYFQNNL